MATTFAFELSYNPNRHGAYCIYLRITQDRKLRRVKTSIEVKRKKDFRKNAKNDDWVKPCEPNHKKWNDTLSKELEEAKSKYRELKENGMATADKIISELQANEKTSSFLEYAKKRCKEIKEEGRERDYKKNQDFVNKLESFVISLRLKDLTFAELTPSMIMKFDRYLHSLHNQRHPDRKLHPNTIAGHMVVFKKYVKRAIEIEGFLKPENNPFVSVRIKLIKTEKEKLDDTEIKKIIDLELKKDSLIWHCRNYFMFSFYVAGIRAGDVMQIRWNNITDDGRINYEMGKNHKDINLRLVPQAQKILSYYHSENNKSTDYIFNLLDNSASYAKFITQQEKDTMSNEIKHKLYKDIESKNALINKYLKKIAKKAGIDKNISFHIARHSFAKRAKEQGIDNLAVKGLLAHTNLSTTEKYMGNFDTEKVDEAMDKIFDNHTSTKKDELLNILNNMSDEEINKIFNQLKK